MRPQNNRNVPLTAAEALREEFVELHGALPDYHAWLSQLPDERRLWLLREDHFKDATLLAERLLKPDDALAQFLREQLHPDTARTLAANGENDCGHELALGALVEDLNRVITSGRPVYDTERFRQIPLRP